MVRETAFNDVFDSQATYRALLDAMSRPGRVFQVPRRAYGAPPAGFMPPALTILKTLCDHRVSFSIGRAEDRGEWIRYLEVNLSTPFGSLEQADYALFDGSVFEEGFSGLKRGTLEFPEHSATALIGVRELAEEAAHRDEGACTLLLEGPGVKGRARLSAAGLHRRYVEERGRANRFFPMGIDIILADPGGRVAGIPRTSRVEVG